MLIPRVPSVTQHVRKFLSLEKQFTTHRAVFLHAGWLVQAATRGIKVIIAAAGMAAHLPGVIAAMTPLPVIGVPVKASLEGIDSMLSIIQMPPGIPVATVGINAAQNAGILAAQIIGTGDPAVMEAVVRFKEGLKKKIIEANEELKKIKYPYKTN